MTVTWALLAAIASVPLTGGSLTRLATLRFTATWLAVLALALQVVIIEVVPGGDGWAHRAVHLGTYGLLFVFVALNVRGIPFLWLMALGGLGNATAIAANGGVMPARPEALAAAGLEPVAGEFVNSGAVADPVLWWLGDVFAVPAAWPASGVFSVGDAALLLGVLLCLHATCRRNVVATLARA